MKPLSSKSLVPVLISIRSLREHCAKPSVMDSFSSLEQDSGLTMPSIS